MKTPLTFIALKRVGYSDRHAIVSVVSRQMGRLSLLVSEGAGREAVRQRALMQPGCLVDAMVDIRPGRTIHPVSRVMPHKPLASLRANPVKSLVALFMADVADKLMRQETPDEPTFDSIAMALEALDCLTDPTALANFPIVFLYRLGATLGIEPDVATWRPGSYFDMQQGVFTITRPLAKAVIEPADAEALRVISRLDYRTAHLFKATREQRNRALDIALAYLGMHTSQRLDLAVKTIDVARSIL